MGNLFRQIQRSQTVAKVGKRSAAIIPKPERLEAARAAVAEPDDCSNQSCPYRAGALAARERNRIKVAKYRQRKAK